MPSPALHPLSLHDALPISNALRRACLVQRCGTARPTCARGAVRWPLSFSWRDIHHWARGRLTLCPLPRGVHAPFAAASGCEIQEDEAIEHSKLTLVQQRIEALRGVRHEIGDCHEA